MSPYLILYGILVCSAVMATRRRGVAYWVVLTALSLFLALRFGQGTDWAGYCYIFLRAPQTIDLNAVYYTGTLHSEFGWKLLMNCMKALGLQFVHVSVLLSLTMMLLINRFILRYSKRPILSMVLLFPTYYLTYLFSGLREGLVIALFLGIMVDLVVDGRLLPYGLMCILCMSLHTASAILVSIPLVVSRVRIQGILALCGVMLLLGCFSSIWIPFLAGANLIHYSDISSVSLLGFCYKVVTAAILYLILHNGGAETLDDKDTVLLKTYALGFAIYLLFFRHDIVASRLSIILLSVEIALIPNLLMRGDVKQQRVMLLLLVCICSFMVAKNLDSYVTQGNYRAGITWYNYPYISIMNRSQLYQVRGGRLDVYTYEA